MFERPNFYKAFRRAVIPFLKTYPSVRIWVVERPSREQAFSLAIQLVEAGLNDKFRIYATHDNEAFLDRLRNGVFPTSSLSRYQKNYRQAGGVGDVRRYFSIKNGRAILNENIKNKVVFFQHNLATDASFNEFQVILCRGIISRINHSLIGRVHGLLFDSLCQFGILGLGSRESICIRNYEARYRQLDGQARLFKKVVG